MKYHKLILEATGLSFAIVLAATALLDFVPRSQVVVLLFMASLAFIQIIELNFSFSFAIKSRFMLLGYYVLIVQYLQVKSEYRILEWIALLLLASFAGILHAVFFRIGFVSIDPSVPPEALDEKT